MSVRYQTEISYLFIQAFSQKGEMVFQRAWLLVPRKHLTTPEHLQNIERVHSCSLDLQAPVEMRAGHAASRTDLPQNSSRHHLIPNLCVDFREVAVEGVNSQSVVHENRVPGEKQLFRQNHAPFLRGVHRRARWRRKIHAAMW